MQLLRTIFIIVLVYYLFRLFARYVLPFLARYFIRKSMNSHQKRTEDPSRKAGEIHVEYAPSKTKPSDTLGEYVEYEEIKEDQTKKS